MPSKTCGVVMLPTHQKANINLGRITGKINFEPDLRILDSGQHLYIISQDKLRGGDYFLWKGTEVHQYHSDAGYGVKTYTNYNAKDGSSLLVNYSNINGKIIATTDTSLGLPELTVSFIKKYIEKYNEGNPITEVLVEFNTIIRDYAEEDIPKINEDNTIITWQWKKSWTKEELSDLIKSAIHSYALSSPDIYDEQYPHWIEKYLRKTLDYKQEII